MDGENVYYLWENERKKNQSLTISTVASKVAAFSQNRQKVFTNATNLATMYKTPFLDTSFDGTLNALSANIHDK